MMRSAVLILLLFFSLAVDHVDGTALLNCPMAGVRAVIQRAAALGSEPAVQMQMIRRVMEDVHGGSWGVLIVRDPRLVSQEVHWTIPDHTNDDGSPAFCLAVIKKWQYNVFKTGNLDAPDRLTVEDFVEALEP